MAEWLGLVPLAYVVYRDRRFPIHVDAAYYWLAAAFGVSFLADRSAHWVPSWVAFSYVVGQSVLTCAVFDRRLALRLLPMLSLVALLALAVWPPADPITHRRPPEVLLHLIAWGTAACVVWEEAKGALRTALSTYFAVGTVAYLVMAFSPGFTTWYLYQASRVVGIGLFCLAVADPKPVKLTLHRARAA